MGLCWAMRHRGGRRSMAGGVCMLLAYAHVYMRTCAICEISTTRPQFFVTCCAITVCWWSKGVSIDHRPTTECGGHAFVTSKGLFIPTLFTTFAAALLSYSRSEMKIKACFYFAFLSLNRTFAAALSKVGCTSEIQRKLWFSFVFLSVCTTFALAINIESEYRR